VTLLDWISIFLCGTGGFFFLAGTVGILRFPDTFTRLHALTKADNLGLGFIVLGLVCQAEAVPVILKLILIWLLTILGGTTACYLIGRHVLLQEERESSHDSS
jgi:multicomponent Na+:H+ antiporter subunit G